MSQYSEAEKMRLKIASTYCAITWLMIAVLVTSAIGAVFLTLHFSGVLKVGQEIFVSVMVLFLILILVMPFSLLYLWIKELKEIV